MVAPARVALALGAAAVAAALAPAAARAQAGDGAAAAIGAAVEASIRERPLLHSARVGIAVVDVATGRELYARDGDGGYSVASNAKLATAAAALARLGPDFRYETAVYADTFDAASGTVRGDLIAVGRGDPSLDADDLRRLARQLRAAGVRRVTGGLALDDSYFDAEALPPHFDEQPDEHASFRAPVSALALNFNAVAIVVRPGAKAGAPAVVSVDPPNDYVRVAGGVATTRSGRQRVSVVPVARPGALEVKVAGRVRADSGVRRYRLRVPDPFAYFGAALRHALAAEGIQLRRRTVVRATPSPQALRLAAVASPPLAVLVRGMGKYSNNFVAEMVFKTLGAESRAEPGPATWRDAQRAVRDFLVADIGLADGSFRLENGSGLFDATDMTPRQLARLLRAAYRDFRYGPDFVAALAFGGADGTLSERFVDGPADRQVRAKTGTLDGVSALSGYVAVDGARPLAFSILVNDVPDARGALRDARGLQDDIVEALIAWLREPP
ncbi:MAG: D-alanyl-D-alanine carboxypeptidase/D-alanyl-D-alanine-endopeptidase [Deltaproteobacteria bacterium]|nr:MAG: D-alanyl-D-alanine carboxypeptidase/D-alanyl-D-alanine-endopeptidase [Deltaproteobacteria bacterium]